MKPIVFKEYRVHSFKIENGRYVFENMLPVIEDKSLTKRGEVSIHEHEARTNNENVLKTKLWYEIAEEAIDITKMNKIQLIEYARKEGIEIDETWTKKELIEKLK